MGREEKTRDEEYWRAFAEMGSLPDLPVAFVDEKGVDYVHAFLAAPYNELSKLLLAEVLASRGALTPEEEVLQCTASKWVRVKIFSKNAEYANRGAMRDALAQFMAASSNSLLARVGGLVKGEAMVEAKARAGEDARPLATACLRRMKSIVSEDARVSGQDAFVSLVISIGWVFGKAHDFISLRETLALVDETVLEGNVFLSERVAKLRAVLDGAVLQPLRNWPTKAKEVFHDTDCTRVFPLMQELARSLPVFAVLREDGRLRNLVLFWISALLAKMKKQGSTIGANLGELILEIVQEDGLEDLPGACWERKVIEPPLGKGEGFFPATAEKLVNGIYGIVKEKYGRQPPATPEDTARVEWLLERMRQIYTRLPDEKWGGFRLGRLLLMLGRIEEAKDLVLPTVRRNQTQFWAWSSLGELFPERRAACLAHALLCKEEETKLAKVRRDALALGLPVDDREQLRRIARDASELLWEGLPAVDAVLERQFKNKDGKDRVQFALRGGVDVRPVSPNALRLSRRLREGDPFSVYLDPGDSTRIVAARPRAGETWDVLEKAVVTYYGRSRKGNAMLGSKVLETTCPLARFVQLDRAPLGTSFEIRYSTRKRDYGTAYEIRVLKPVEDADNCLVPFEGPIRLPNGLRAAGFVGDVYVPPELLTLMVDRGLAEGTLVNGRAIRLPPRVENDRFGRPHRKDRIQAVSLEILGGEALARYRANRS